MRTRGCPGRSRSGERKRCVRLPGSGQGLHLAVSLAEVRVDGQLARGEDGCLDRLEFDISVGEMGTRRGLGGITRLA